MLLHATLVILFGTSHGGGAGRGQGLPDALDVTFRRQPAPADAGLPGVDAATGRDLLAAPQSSAAPARSEPRPGIEPAKTGRFAPVEPFPAAPEPDRAPPEALPPQREPAVEALPRIDLRAPQEVDKPLLPPLVAPPAIERLAPPPNPSELAPAPDTASRPSPEIPAAPVQRLTAPAVQHELATPPRLPAPVPGAPFPPAAPIERLEAPRIDRELAPPPKLVAPSPAVSPPAETPPAQVERTVPPAGARPVPAPSEAAVPAPDARAVPGERGAPATTVQPRLRLGSPAGPDEDMFKPRRDVVPAGEGGAPRLDMEAARQRAREIASEATSTRGLLPALPPPPERQSKESHALEKAVKPDCRTAYAGMGLLAVPVLVASTIGDAGCRW